MLHTPIDMLGNTSEVEVPLQKIGSKVEAFSYKKKRKMNKKRAERRRKQIVAQFSLVLGDAD